MPKIVVWVHFVLDKNLLCLVVVMVTQMLIKDKTQSSKCLIEQVVAKVQNILATLSIIFSHNSVDCLCNTNDDDW